MAAVVVGAGVVFGVIVGADGEPVREAKAHPR
jgi:hypothetical protein